jgi:hypothetical protein
MMPAAEVSIGVRVAGVTRQDVRAELWQRRSLVKTYGPRGTVHVFPADEARLWSAALRASARANEAREARRLANMGLEPRQIEAIVAAIGDALDGQRLTREELGQEVARRLGTWATEAVSPAFGGQWPRWLLGLGAAANADVLCFGPPQGTKVTFVRPDQWLGDGELVDERAALLEVFRRYLSAYGPATHHEFAQWFGMPPGAAHTLTRELANELEEMEIEGHRAWVLANETESDWPKVRDVVRLLPHFDCYLVGCHPRERLVAADWAGRALTRGAIGNRPLLVLDGVVAGLWQQRRVERHFEIRVEAFQPLDAEQRKGLAAAAARLGEIEEAESTVSLGTVDAGPHL